MRIFTQSVDGQSGAKRMAMDILAEIRRVMMLEGQTIAHLAHGIGPAYEEAVRTMYACTGKVIVTGMGKSDQIAQKIAATLVSTGTAAPENLQLGFIARVVSWLTRH